MFDDPGDDADCDSLLFVQPGNREADIILLAGCAKIIAGVGNSVDAVIEPDVDNAAPHIGDPVRSIASFRLATILRVLESMPFTMKSISAPSIVDSIRFRRPISSRYSRLEGISPV